MVGGSKSVCMLAGTQTNTHTHCAWQRLNVCSLTMLFTLDSSSIQPPVLSRRAESGACVEAFVQNVRQFAAVSPLLAAVCVCLSHTGIEINSLVELVPGPCPSWSVGEDWFP